MEHKYPALKQIIQQALKLDIAGSISLAVTDSTKENPTSIFLTAGHTSCTEETSDHTIYDVASLTKIIGTVPAMAMAVADGKISLKERPFPLWPKINVGHLLSHRSGLSAHRPFFSALKAHAGHSNYRAKFFHMLFNESPIAPPQTIRIYSDLNYVALGKLLEDRYHRPLFSVFLSAWKRLNFSDKFLYFPSDFLQQHRAPPTVAPTAFATRGHNVIRGQVHDDNCFYLGGIAGHAGLFATLQATHNFGIKLLQMVKNPHNELSEVFRYFVNTNMGFDYPRGSVGSLSPQSFGHFGFTGTSLWIDPQRNLVITLLTNRVLRGRNSQGIYWLRRKIHHTLQ